MSRFFVPKFLRMSFVLKVKANPDRRSGETKRPRCHVSPLRVVSRGPTRVVNSAFCWCSNRGKPPETSFTVIDGTSPLVVVRSGPGPRNGYSGTYGRFWYDLSGTKGWNVCTLYSESLNFSNRVPVSRSFTVTTSLSLAMGT